MAGESPNSSIFDQSSDCPKERFYSMGRTIDTRSPEGVHEIRLFNDSRFQKDTEPFGTITHSFLEDGSSFFDLKDELEEAQSGTATLTIMESADKFSFSGPDASGQQLTANFTVTTTRMKGVNHEYYDNISLTQTLRVGDLTQYFSGEDHQRLVGMFKAAKQIRENKPYYNFTALCNLLKPFMPTPQIVPIQNLPNTVNKR